MITVHQAFEKQAANRPDTIAIIEDSLLVTYRQLNEKANQLLIIYESKGYLIYNKINSFLKGN